MRSYTRITLSIALAGLIVVGMMLAFNYTVSARSQSQTLTSQSRSPVAPDHTENISRAMAYLESVQSADGGFGDEFTTLKAVLAAASAQYPMDYLTSVSGTTALEYLETHAFTYTHDLTGTLLPGRAGMLAVAAVAGDASPYAFGGVNLVDELTDAYHAATGAYSTTAQQGLSSGAAGTVNQWWALLGLAAAQEAIPVTATDYLLGLQEVDGGWGYGSGGDVDATAHALQALLASGNVTPTRLQVQQGVGFLRAQQNEQGGWDAWSGPSADSTAAVMQSLAALGYTPATESWAVASNVNPHTALVDFQTADGSFGGGALGTANAVLGLTETPLPIFGREQRARLALTWMQEQQAIDGSWEGTVGATIDAVLAYAAAGFDPDTVMATGSVTSAVDYLEAQATTYAALGPNEAGKLALAAEMAGGDASNFGGIDLVGMLTSTYYSPTLQAFGVPTDTYQQAFPILGLVAAEAPLPAGVTTTLAGLQQVDGGWQGPYGSTGADHTGIVMQALLAAGVPISDPMIASATQYLADQQTSGGWGSWGTVNANSTAYAMQGLLAAGEDLGSAASAWRQGARDPYGALASFQKSDGPFVWAWAPYGYTDNGLATWQAVPALLGVSYPFTPHTLAPFIPVDRGLDPDRIVTAAPRAALGDSVDIRLPFGSDLDRDATVTMSWRLDDGAWQTATVQRANGYFTATADQAAGSYEVQMVFDDPDGVQGQETVYLAPIGAQTDHQVALVVRFDEEMVVTRCISFTEAQISGYEALERSGLEIVANFSGMGATICKIEATGCSADHCFCDSPPNYWSYWHLEGETWGYSQAGANDYQVSDGDVDGWGWGPAVPPPVIPFDDICAPPPTDISTPTVTATASPTRRPLPTPMPTAATRSQASFPTSYVVFGLISGGLLIGLLLSVRRRG